MLCWGYGTDVSIDNDDGDGMLEYIPCAYVHQLQNLYYALTGEELTISQTISVWSAVGKFKKEKWKCLITGGHKRSADFEKRNLIKQQK